MYKARVDELHQAKAHRVEVCLYSQSIPPGYLQQRFHDASRGHKKRDEIDRLYYLTSHLNVQAIDNDAKPFISEWKLLLACASRRIDDNTVIPCQ